MGLSLSITAEDIVRLFEQDARARRRLAELLFSEPETKSIITSAILRDVATKQDLERLREEIKQDIEKVKEDLRREFSE